MEVLFFGILTLALCQCSKERKKYLEKVKAIADSNLAFLQSLPKRSGSVTPSTEVIQSRGSGALKTKPDFEDNMVKSILISSSPKRQKKSSDTKDVDLSSIKQTPQVFSGQHSDISRLVEESESGIVIISHGIPHIWRVRSSAENCYEACLYEKLIVCNFYFYNAFKEKCIMMKSDYGNPTTEPTEHNRNITVEELEELEDVIASLPHSRSKHSSDTEDVDLSSIKQTPQVFSGQHSDISRLVEESESGIVIISHGIPHIWRVRSSAENCYEACLYEKLIVCNFYFYNAFKEKCIMMKSDYRNPTTEPTEHNRNISVEELEEFEDVIASLPHSRSKRSSDTEDVDLSSIKQTPQVFSGQHSDISRLVEESESGIVIISHGIPHIWRVRSSAENCYEACLYEKLIVCNFYFYNAFKEKCIMMKSDYGNPTTEPTEHNRDISVEELEELEDVIASLPHSRSKHSSDTEDVDLSSIKQTPQVFSGQHSDISRLVEESESGIVIISHGIPHIWRVRSSAENCYEACLYEKLIVCNFYFYNAFKEKCIMMKSDYGNPTTEPTEHNRDISVEELEEFKDAIASLPHSRSKRILEEESDPTPIQFDGNLSDIPSEVIASKHGTEVTVKNINYIWRPRGTLKACKQACEYEQIIQCVYYLYDQEYKRCIMFSNISPQVKWKTEKEEDEKSSEQRDNETLIAEMGEEISSVQIGEEITSAQIGEEITSAQIGDEISSATVGDETSDEGSSKERLDYLKQVILKIEAALENNMNIVDDNKNLNDHHLHELQTEQKSVRHSLDLLSHSVKQIVKVNPYLLKEIDGMHNLQESVTEELQHFGSFEKKMTQVLKSLNNKISQLSEEMKAMKTFNNKLMRQMKGEEFANPNFNKQIIQMKRDLDELTLKIENNPVTIKMKKNQHVLAQALEAIDRELVSGVNKLNHIDVSTSDWAGRLITEEQHRKAINDVVQIVIKNIKDLRNDVRKLRNPQSEENIEKTQEIRQMRSDIDILERANAKLEQDLGSAREKMTHMVKELYSMQALSQDNSNNIVALKESIKNLVFDNKLHKADQHQMANEIKALVSVYQDVVSSLHSLKNKQMHVVHDFGKYNEDMRLTKNVVLAYGENSGSKRIDQMSKSMVDLSSLRTFQLKLFMQINELKRNVNKMLQRFGSNVNGVPPKMKEALPKMKGARPKNHISKSRMDDVLSRLNQAISRIGEAQSSMDEAKSKMNEAQPRMNEAKSSMNEAQSRMNDAQSKMRGTQPTKQG